MKYTLRPEYGEALHHPATFEYIASELLSYGSVVINWFDGDIYVPMLFSSPRLLFGREAQLFVTIAGYGTMVFPIRSNTEINSDTLRQGYSKAGISYPKCAELIQGVIDNLV